MKINTVPHPRLSKKREILYIFGIDYDQICVFNIEIKKSTYFCLKILSVAMSLGKAQVNPPHPKNKI